MGRLKTSKDREQDPTDVLRGSRDGSVGNVIHHLQRKEGINVTGEIDVTCVMNMRARTRPNACEVRFAKVTKGSNEANSFPLPPRRKVISQEDTRDSLRG